MDSNQPIGIFDSGVGGLTVASAIKRVLPSESIIYYGDTRHSPYGNKSEETIQEYSSRIVKFLLEQKCKAIVIACNTASALAYAFLRKQHPDVLFINVVDPVVNHVGRKINHKVGIIATRATTKSGIYRKKLRRLNPKLNVVSAATPLLVSIVEEGFTNTSISSGAIDAYLSNKKFSDVSSLILGCTHFPLLQKELEQYFGGRTEIVDSPELVAHQLKLELQKNGLMAEERTPVDQFFVSEKTSNFERTARMFFGKELQMQEKILNH